MLHVYYTLLHTITITISMFIGLVVCILRRSLLHADRTSSNIPLSARHPLVSVPSPRFEGLNNCHYYSNTNSNNTNTNNNNNNNYNTNTNTTNNMIIINNVSINNRQARVGSPLEGQRVGVAGGEERARGVVIGIFRCPLSRPPH